MVRFPLSQLATTMLELLARRGFRFAYAICLGLLIWAYSAMAPGQQQTLGFNRQFDAALPWEARTLQASDIEKAVRNAERVEIRNAVIHGPLKLSNAQFSDDFFLINCQLDSEADFSSSTFLHNAVFNGTVFHAGVRFIQAKFKANLAAQRTEFDNTSWFSDLEVNGVVNFQESMFSGNTTFNFALLGKVVDFRGATFRYDAQFDGATATRVEFGTEGPGPNQGVKFDGNVSFKGSHLGEWANFSDAIFASDANFSRMQVKGSASFDRATFKGKAIFTDVQVDSEADFDRVHFASGTSLVAFRNARFGGDTSFQNAVFDAPVYFSNIQVAGATVFSGAQFAGQAYFDDAQMAKNVFFGALPGSNSGAAFKQGASFHAAEFTKDADFFQTTFNGSLDFEEVRVGGVCRFEKATFRGRTMFAGLTAGQAGFQNASFDDSAYFDGARVSGNFFLSGAAFNGEARLLAISVGGQSDFSGTKFHKLTRFDGAAFGSSSLFRNTYFFAGSEPYFGNTRFHKYADFRDVEFEDPVSFTAAQFDEDVAFENVTFRKTASFDYSQFLAGALFGAAQTEKGGPAVGRTTFSDVSFDGADFKNVADFRMAMFTGKTSFRISTFRALLFSPSDKQFQGPVDLRGCKYDRIQGAWQSVLAKLDPYDPQPFTQLESAFRSSGQSDDADEVYVYRRDSERRQARWTTWVGLSFLKLIANYGTNTTRLLAVSALLILFGSWAFSRIDAVRKDDKSLTTISWRAALWLSLSIFAPIPLAVPSAYQPSLQLLQRICAELLKYAGVILVPLFLLGIAGLLQYIPR